MLFIFCFNPNIKNATDSILQYYCLFAISEQELDADEGFDDDDVESLSDWNLSEYSLVCFVDMSCFLFCNTNFFVFVL